MRAISREFKTKYGEDVLRSVVNAETGNGMLVNPNYNKGKTIHGEFQAAPAQRTG